MGPLVSVITPTYNSSSFIRETIETVLAQTYAPIEHILVDDASEDATPQLLDEYAQRFPARIRTLALEARAGPCRRRNDALTLARGKYVAWLDHDDLWHPAKIERQVGVMQHDPRLVLVYTDYEIFDDADGRVVARQAVVEAPDMLRALFVEGCFIASSTVLFRADALRRRGGRLRDSEFSFGDDYFLWLSLLLDGEAVHIGNVIARLRRHSSNESARLAEKNFHAQRVVLLDEFVETFPEATARLGAWRRRGLARHLRAAAAYELASGRRAKAAAYAARAAVHDPGAAARWALERVWVADPQREVTEQ